MAGRRAKPASGFRTVVPFFLQGRHGSSIKLLGRSSDAIVEGVRIHNISLLPLTHPDFIYRKSLQLIKKRKKDKRPATVTVYALVARQLSHVFWTLCSLSYDWARSPLY